MPLASEYPLVLPGYFYQELSARGFVALTGEYTIPLDPNARWTLTPIFTAATVDYLPGLAQSGHFNSGAGLTLGVPVALGRVANDGDVRLRVSGDPIERAGGQTVGVMCEIDLGAVPGRANFQPGMRRISRLRCSVFCGIFSDARTARILRHFPLATAKAGLNDAGLKRMIELYQFPWSPFCLAQRRILNTRGRASRRSRWATRIVRWCGG